ncbi:MAG: SDR family oxidoreductase [Planctomycetota bacterium]
MAYLLITGATGFLGGYLLRDTLLARLPVAVLVRARTSESARDRIECVMQSWETQLQRNLPRPIVVSGDLHESGLELSSEDRHWIASNCDAVLHSAASVSFHAESETGEPYRSNVEGTQNLLEFCREAGIRRFHHVSTAYVCGTCNGDVSENNFSAEGPFGNDYEKSKARAEQLLREATFLDETTIFRPSIIVGDSQTGFASGYHGIYTSLQLGYLYLLDKLRNGWRLDESLARQVVEESFVKQLGLVGTERKNLVTVDWVSAAVVRILRAEKQPGQTYHLTNPKPVSITALAEAMIAAVLATVGESTNHKAGIPAALRESEGFREHMAVYRSYFRDDPVFDVKNTQRIATELPCPALDHETLVKLWNYALRADFVWRRPQISLPELDVAARIEQLPEEVSQPDLQLEASGPGGGSWRIRFEGDHPVAVERGIDTGRATDVYATTNALSAIANQEITIEQAVSSGRLVLFSDNLSNDAAIAMLRTMFEWLTTREPMAEAAATS